MFSQYPLNADPPEGEYRAPKLNHKKSRYGCLRCRQRRVKCNEAKPICGNCERHRVQCVYDRVRNAKTDEVSSHLSPPSEANRAPDDHSEKLSHSPSASELDDVAPESKERRLLETKIMHRYLTSTGPILGIDEKTRKVFADEIPRLALKSEGLLYAMYALTAIHSYLCDADGTMDWLDIHRRYMALGVGEHNKEVTNIDASNVDAVCLTSHVVRICAFATLRLRNRNPYTPPLEWLRISGGSQILFEKSWHILQNTPDSGAWQVMQSSPIMWDLDERFGEAYRKGWEYLLERYADDDQFEPWDAEIQDAYETTISYIGGVLANVRIEDETQMNEVRRRLIVFPMFIKRRFVTLVEENRPRALVILAHYFAILSLEKGWWVGTTAVDEVRAIAGEVTGKWRDMLRWPLDVVEKRAELTGPGRS